MRSVPARRVGRGGRTLGDVTVSVLRAGGGVSLFVENDGSNRSAHLAFTAADFRELIGDWETDVVKELIARGWTPPSSDPSTT